MRFSALACDYDGTLASEDRIGPEALAALEQARQAGRTSRRRLRAFGLAWRDASRQKNGHFTPLGWRP